MVCVRGERVGGVGVGEGGGEGDGSHSFQAALVVSHGMERDSGGLEGSKDGAGWKAAVSSWAFGCRVVEKER